MASPQVIPRTGKIDNDFILNNVSPTGKEIGRGAYGRVFEVDYQGTLCAAKEVHTLLLEMSQNEEIKSDFLSECQIWSTLRHPCVVQFLGVYYPETDQYKLPVMVMEKMEQSLSDLVEKYNDIPLNVKLSILDDVCFGLRYLHGRSPPIVHRDLTPNNILIGGQLEAKITDLGVAKVMMQTEDCITMTKVPGTPAFMPPEALVRRSTYEPPLDIFSYGGVILNIITHMWPDPSDREQFNLCTDKWEVVSELTRRQAYLDELIKNAPELRQVVTSCLNDNPSRRPSVVEVSIEIKRVKQIYSQKAGHDGMSRLVWWASQQDEMISHTIELTNELKAENESLRAKNAYLRIANAENAQLHLEIQRLQNKMKGCDHQLPTDIILISGPLQISCDGQTGRYFVWREHGLQLYLPTNCAHQRVVVTMSLYVPIRSQLSSEVHIVSSVYYLQTNIKRFSNAVTIHLQHCVKLKSEEDCQKLCFVIHDKDNKTTVNGKFHIGHSYGTIEVKSFCYIYIVWEAEGGITIRSLNEHQQGDSEENENTANLGLSDNNNLETPLHPPSNDGLQSSTESNSNLTSEPSTASEKCNKNFAEEAAAGPTFVYEEMLVVPSNHLSLIDKNWNGTYLIYRNLEGWRLFSIEVIIGEKQIDCPTDILTSEIEFDGAVATLICKNGSNDSWAVDCVPSEIKKSIVDQGYLQFKETDDPGFPKYYPHKMIHRSLIDVKKKVYSECRPLKCHLLVKGVLPPQEIDLLAGSQDCITLYKSSW